MSISVTAPDGQTWHVHREFQWPRFREPDDFDITWFDALAFAQGADSIAAVVVSLVLFVGAAVLIFILLPPLLFVAELALATVGLLLAFRPWLVVAESDTHHLEWKVKGWRRSRRAVKRIARQLRAGETLTERW
jgi:hypothetical protein